MGSYLVVFDIETFENISDTLFPSVFTNAHKYGQFPAHSTHIDTQTYNYGFKTIIETYNEQPYHKLNK